MTTFRPEAFEVTIKTITPLHIGSGQQLAAQVDYLQRGEAIWIVDVDRLIDKLDRSQDTERLNKLLDGKELDIVLGDMNFDSEVMRKARLKTNSHANEIREFIKSAGYRPYIPGSTIKGLLRTCIADHNLQQEGSNRYEMEVFKNRKGKFFQAKYAAQNLENRLFAGRSNKAKEGSNRSIFRALRVSDANIQHDIEMCILEVQALSNGRNRGTFFIEALPEESCLVGQLSVDRYLLDSPLVGRVIDWSESKRNAASVEHIVKAARALTNDRLNREQKRWGQNGLIGAFYHDHLPEVIRQCEQEGLTFIAQLGWGGGWDSKTFYRSLVEKDFFKELVKRYKIIHRGNYSPHLPLPKSRRVIVEDKSVYTGIPGWVKVQFNKL